MWGKILARSTTTLGPWLLLIALSTSCSSGSDEPGSASDMTVAEYCKQSAESICANLAACCSITVEACIDKHRSGCEESGNNATSRGLSFNADAAQGCVQAAAGLYDGCVVPSAESSSAASTCGMVFTPTLRVGASCTFDAACLGGEGQVGVCSSGTCAQVPVLADGAPCGETAQGICSSGAYCDDTCQRRKMIGQSCGAALECASGSCESSACGARPIGTICAALTDEK